MFPKPTPARPILGDASKGESRGLLQNFLELVKVSTCLKGACAALKFARIDVWEEGIDCKGEKVDNRTVLIKAFGYETSAYGILQFHPQIAMGYEFLVRDCEGDLLCYGCLREKRWQEKNPTPKVTDRSGLGADTSNVSEAEGENTTVHRQQAFSMDANDGLSTAGNLEDQQAMDLTHEQMR